MYALAVGRPLSQPHPRPLEAGHAATASLDLSDAEEALSQSCAVRAVKEAKEADGRAAGDGGVQAGLLRGCLLMQARVRFSGCECMRLCICARPPAASPSGRCEDSLD